MKTIRHFVAFALFLSANLVFQSTAIAGPECTCRHSGGEVAEGQTACIKSPTGMKMARCERVLNNTSWKMLDTPCPYSEAPSETNNNISIALLDFSKNN